MAAYYWDYNATAGSGNVSTTTATTTASDTRTVYVVTTVSTDMTTGSNGIQVNYSNPPRQREILVEHPAEWTEEQHAKYVQMVNDHLHTGWRVTMLIRGGDIAITDPNVEIRKMRDFVPLLKDRASVRDKKIIDVFFEANPAT